MTSSADLLIQDAYDALQRKDYAAAQNSLLRALELAPEHPVANALFGVLAQTMREIDYAEYYLRRALESAPDYPFARQALVGVLEGQGRLRDAIALAEAGGDDATLAAQAARLKRILETPQETQGLKHLEADVTSAELLAQARELAKQFPPEEPLEIADPDPGRTLRVGFVSGNLHQHPVGFFLESVLAALDPARCETHIYYNKRNEDALTARMKHSAKSWTNITGEPDDAVLQRIRNDFIDILIDLSGYTSAHRLAVFARRAAPVQMTWIGYYDTTGIPAMDYILCDARLLPPEQEPYFTEQPLRLPDSYLCFSKPDYETAVNEPPARANGYVTFGSFNKVIKINDEVVRWWSEILKRVEGSKLMLLAKPGHGPLDVEQLIDRFSGQGIGRERLIMRGRGQRNHMLERYREIDIALDPFPYNGGTTTAEALWMGVPVVNRIGEAFVSRVGYSMLGAAGHPEWCAGTREEYIEKAVALASNLEALAAIRTSLRRDLLASPLMDAPRFARHFEAAMRQAWQGKTNKTNI